MGNAVAPSTRSEDSSGRAEADAHSAAGVEPSADTATMEERWRRLYGRLHGPMITKAARYIGPDSARDVFQDVMLEFWGRIRDGELTFDQLNEFTVLQAVRNRVVNEVTRRPDYTHVPLTPELEDRGVVPHISPMTDGDSMELNVAIDRVLQRLSPQQQKAWTLYVVEEFTREETARMMGISEDSVKTHIRRATVLVRKALVKAGWRSRKEVQHV